MVAPASCRNIAIDPAGVLSVMPCLRQLGPQFPANGRKSNGTSVQTLLQLHMGISTKMRANQ